MIPIERWIETHPRVSLTLLALLFLIAVGLAGQDDPESEAIAAQQHAEMQAWEQGFRQGQAAAACTHDFSTQSTPPIRSL